MRENEEEKWMNQKGNSPKFNLPFLENYELQFALDFLDCGRSKKESKGRGVKSEKKGEAAKWKGNG